MKRRTILLAGVGAVGALFVGWAVLPVGQRQRGKNPLPVREGGFAPNAWLKIDSDDTVTVIMPRVEMGQGAQTGLAMLVAEELDADWSRVRIEFAPFDSVYNNLSVASAGLPFQPDDHGFGRRAAVHLTDKVVRHIGVMITGGSSSLDDLWSPLREAGAYTRAVMVGLAAERWQVDAASCTVERGAVMHTTHGRLRFGELIAQLRGRDPDAVLPRGMANAASRLKQPAQRNLLGRSPMRLDTPSKVDGSARFAADFHEPGMCFATLEFAPQRDATVKRIDAAPALAVKGVERVFAVPAVGGAAAAVAVIAATRHAALRGREALKVDWQPGVAGTFDDTTIERTLQTGLSGDDDGFKYRNDGDARKVLAGPAAAGERTLTAEYSVPYLAHAALEPPVCAIRFDGNAARVVAGVQIPDAACAAVARQLGLQPEQVSFEQTSIGGAFGRRLDHDFVVQAAAIARELPNRYVQVQWRREDDLRQDFYRPAIRARLQARVDAQGRIVAWHGRSAGQSITVQAMQRTFGLPMGGPDKTTVEGAYDVAYEIPQLRVAHRNVDLPVPVGYWRSVGHSYQGFFVETFVDELAALAGVDPVEFRARHLANHPRHLAVLRKAAEAAGWGTPLAAAADGAPVARGIALVASFGSVVAEVAEVSIAPDGRPRVHRVVVAIDCGTPIHPGLIAQQMEGGVVFGLTAALDGDVPFAAGSAQIANFDDYPILRHFEAPHVETHILPSTAPPTGVGEPAVPPLAPAVANALAVLSGKRVRKLPLRGLSGIVRGLSAGA